MNTELTRIEKSQDFAAKLVASIGIKQVLDEAPNSPEMQAMLELVVQALLQHPEPAEA